MNFKRINLIGFLLVVLYCLGMAAKSIFIPLLYGAGLQSGEIVAGRLLYAIPFFWLFFLTIGSKQNIRLPDRKEWLVLLGCAALTSIPLVTHIIAYALISPAVTAVLVYVFPLFVAFLEWIVFKQKPARGFWLAIPFVYTGVLVLVWGGNAPLEIKDWRGVAYTLAAAVSFAIFLVVQVRVYAPKGPLRFDSVGYCSWCSLIIPFVVFPVVQGDIRDYSFLWDRQVVLLFSGFAFFSTALPFVCFLVAVRLLGATTAAMLSTITPGLSVVLTSLLLGDTLTPFQYTGVFLMLMGLVILQGSKQVSLSGKSRFARFLRTRESLGGLERTVQPGTEARNQGG